MASMSSAYVVLGHTTAHTVTNKPSGWRDPKSLLHPALPKGVKTASRHGANAGVPFDLTAWQQRQRFAA